MYRHSVTPTDESVDKVCRWCRATPPDACLTRDGTLSDGAVGP